jgi:RNA polymerase-binding transcription factor DksA
MMVDLETVRTHLEQERIRLERMEQGSAERLEQTGAGQSSELSSFDQHPGDQATELHDRQVDAGIIGDLRAQLDDVEAALRRIDAGTYGRCDAGDHPIGEDRLKARPTARFCLEHQQQAEVS